MPTPEKVERVDKLKDKIERSTITVTTNYSGIGVNEMIELRRRMRGAGVEFTIVKNTLLNRAAEAANRPQLNEIVEGPTAVAFGYEDPSDVAKALAEYIRSARSSLTIRGAVLGDAPPMPARDVERMATLPSKPQLIANLMGQLNAPMYRLLGVLNGPLYNFGGLLQARIQQLESAESSG